MKLFKKEAVCSLFCETSNMDKSFTFLDHKVSLEQLLDYITFIYDLGIIQGMSSFYKSSSLLAFT